MGSQTTYYGRLLMPELGGPRMTVITGTHKFTSSASVCTLTVPFKVECAGVQLAWRTHPASFGKTLWSSGVISSKAIKISRSTGTSSGATFYYKLIGW